VQQIAPSIQSAARSAHALESSNARVYSLDTKPAQLYPMNNFYALSRRRCIISSRYVTSWTHSYLHWGDRLGSIVQGIAAGPHYCERHTD